MNKLKEYLRHPASFAVFLLVIIASLITVSAALFIVVYILVKGIPNFSAKLFELDFSSKKSVYAPVGD